MPPKPRTLALPAILPDALPRHIKLPSGTVPVQWRRSARARRFSLRLSPQGTGVIVTLPPTGSPQTGLSLLERNVRWIENQLRGATSAAPHLLPGAELSIEGVPHRIRHVPDGKGGAWLEEGALCVSGDPVFCNRRVQDFLRHLAVQRLGACVTAHARETGLAPRSVTIRDAKSRWGSCSSTGRIMLSWRLILAPPFVRDYVILHELAHLRHLNHSEAFWALVDTLTPQRHAAQRWLKANGSALMRVGALNPDQGPC